MNRKRAPWLAIGGLLAAAEAGRKFTNRQLPY
jgi:hypothetical protein